jgi:phosphatidylglycerophosphate synthase
MQVSYLTVPIEDRLPIGTLLDATEEDLLILEGHYVIEAALLESLVRAGITAILCDDQRTATSGVRDYAGAAFLTRKDLDRLSVDEDPLLWPVGFMRLPEVRRVDVRETDLYVPEVRRDVEPFWYAVSSEADAEQCKSSLVTGSQKRTVDLVAWYINRPLENWLTLRLVDRPITPNQMSMITSLVAFIVTGLLLGGWLWLAIILALVVNVLDGVDGKLARAKALTTHSGQLEHSIDLLYEQSWYIAYAWAAFRLRPSLAVLAVGFVMLLCDSFARHVSMQFRKVTGIALADYAPFDRRFRRLDGRRNIYTIYMLLGIVAGQPFYALVAMALHAAITGLVYFVRAGLHLRRADRGISGRRS